jgi:hypothetical protein
VSRQRVSQLLVGIALTAVSFLGVLYQVNESMADDPSTDGSVPRLVCPLH